MDVGAVLRGAVFDGEKQGQPLALLGAQAFGVDSNALGDVQLFNTADVLGPITAHFLSPQTQFSALTVRGKPLPDWLHFDPTTLTFSGVMPADQTTPDNVEVKISDPTDNNSFVRYVSFKPDDALALSQGVDESVATLDDLTFRSAFSQSETLNTSELDATTSVTATLADGEALPTWLTFDAADLTFEGVAPTGTAPVAVDVVYSDSAATSAAAASYTQALTLDPSALAQGVDVGDDLAMLSLGAHGGAFSAGLLGYQPLPEWLAFDPDSVSLALSGVAPDANAQEAVVQVTFTPTAQTLAHNVFASSDGSFTLQFIVQPNQPLDPGINKVLANAAFFGAQGLFGVDLSQATAITAEEQNGDPLPSWLSFDAKTLTFSGMPPSNYVGSIPVQIDVTGNGSTPPSFAILTNAVVDPTYTIAKSDSGFNDSVQKTLVSLTAPSSFNGGIAVNYTSIDDLGTPSLNSATDIVNVAPEPVAPTAADETYNMVQGGALSFTLDDLLNDCRDNNGDFFWADNVTLPSNGVLAMLGAKDTFATPTSLANLTGGVYSATLADGTALPSWMVIDPTTGVITARPPLATEGAYAVNYSWTDGTTTQTAQASYDIDGNVGVSFVYTPNPGFFGADSFAYTVTDGGQSATATVKLNVAPALVANTVTYDINSDTPIVIDPATLLAADAGADTPFTLTGVDDAVNGTLSYDGKQITFTSSHYLQGEASFDYSVADSAGDTAQGTVIFNVTSIDQPPVANSITYNVQEDQALTVSVDDLLSHDSDPLGNAFHLVSITPNSGTPARVLMLPGNQLQFVPNQYASGDMGFTYVISDGYETATGALDLDVSQVDIAPFANPDGVFDGVENSPVSIPLEKLLGNDVDISGHTFSVASVTTAGVTSANGTVQIVGDDAVFTPTQGYYGTAQFAYSDVDSLDAVGAQGTVNLYFAPLYHPPIAIDDMGYSMLQGGTLTLDPNVLMANDIDPDGKGLTFVGFTAGPVTELPNGLYLVTPPPLFSGQLTLTYAVTNDSGLDAIADVFVDVKYVDLPPVAVDDSFDMLENQPLALKASKLLANDYSAQQKGVFFDGILATQNVTVSVDADDNLTITPDRNFHGDANFEYQIDDSVGDTATAWVDLTVAHVNQPPVIGAVPALSTNEDQAFSATLPQSLFTDPDDDALVINVDSPGGAALPGWLRFDRQSLTLSGSPPAGFYGGVTLEVSAFDGQYMVTAPLTLTVNQVILPPTAKAGAITLANDATTDLTSLIQSLVVPGVLGDVETITGLTATNGAVSLLNGDAVYTSRAIGSDTLNYTVTDENGNTATAAIAVTVDPGPSLALGALTLGQSETKDVTALIAGLAKPGLAGDQLTLTTVSATSGSVADVNGVVTYSAPASGTDTIAFTYADQLGDTATGSVDVTVDPGPSLTTTGVKTVLRGQSVTVANAAPGLMGDSLSLVVIQAPTLGALSFVNGAAIYTPPAAVAASGADDSFKYRVVDQYGDLSPILTTTLHLDPGPIAANGAVTVGNDQILDETAYVQSLVTASPAGGAASIVSASGRATASNGVLTYESPAAGTDSFTYTVADQLGETATGTVSVTVDAGPSLTAANVTEIGHGAAATLATASPGLAGDTLSLTVTSTPSFGALSLVNGKVTYVAPANVPAGGESDSFAFAVTDQYNDVSSVVASTLAIDTGPSAANGALTVGHNQSLNETSYLMSLIAPGLAGDVETLTAVSGDASLANGVVTYASPASGTDSFTYTVTDQFGETATGTVNVTVDSGPLLSNGALSVGFAQTTNIAGLLASLAAPGMAGDRLSLVGVSAAHGSVAIVNGAVNYTAPVSGSDVISFTYADQLGDRATASVNVTTSTPLLTVAQALAQASGGYPLAVGDSAANVAAAFDALNGLANLSSITLTGSGTPALPLSIAQIFNDATALGKVVKPYTVTPTDTPADIAALTSAQMAKLKAAGYAGIASTSALTLTLTQAAALTAAGLTVTGGPVTIAGSLASVLTLTTTQAATYVADGYAIAVADKAATIEAMTATQVASLVSLKVTRLQATDAALVVSAATAKTWAADHFVMSAPAGDAVEILDSAANIAALTAANIAAVAAAGVNAIVSNNGATKLTVAQATALETTHAVVWAQGSSVTLADTTANLQSLSVAQIGGLKAIGVTAVAPTNALMLNVAQALAFNSAGLSPTLLSGTKLTISDTGANLQALTTAQIGILAAMGAGSMTATGGGVALTVAQANALEIANIALSAPVGAVVSVTDTASAIATLTSAQIAKLSTLHVTQIVAKDAGVALTQAQSLALSTAEITLTPPSGASNSIVDTAANLTGLTTAQIAALAGQHVSRVASNDANLVLTAAQVIALARAKVALAAPHGDAVQVSDAAANLHALTPARILTLAAAGVTLMTATGGAVTYSVAQAVALEAGPVNVAAAGSSVSLSDTGANLKTLAATQIALLPSLGFAGVEATTALKLNVAQALALAGDHMTLSLPSGTKLAISATAAHLQALTTTQISTLAGLGVAAIAAKVSGVTLTVAQATALKGAGIALTPPAGATDNVTDTASAIATLTATQIAGLTTLHVALIAASDAGVTLSVAQSVALSTAKIGLSAPAGASDAILDTATNIAALTTTQIAALTAQHVARVASNDAKLQLTLAQDNAFSAANVKLAAPSGAAVVVADTAANLHALSVAQINSLALAGVTALAANGAVTYTVVQTAAIEAGKLVASASSGGVTLTDTPANVATLTPAQIILLPGAGFTAVSVTSTLILNVMQALALVADGLKPVLPAGLKFQVSDTAAALQALSAPEIGSLGRIGVSVWTPTGAGFVLSVAQAIALETAGIGVTPPSGGVDGLADTAAAIQGLTATQIAGLTGLHVTAIAASDTGVTLNAAQSIALASAGVGLTAPVGFSNSLVDLGKAIAAMSTTQLAALSAQHVTRVVASDATLALTIAQANAVAKAGAKLAATAAGSLVEVADTAANLQALTVAVIGNLAGVGVTTLVSATAGVKFTVAQAVELEKVGMVASASSGAVLYDTAANLDALTVSQIAGLAGVGVAAITSTGNLSLTTAQGLALVAAGLKPTLPAGGAITLTDSAANLQALSATQITSLRGVGVTAWAPTGSGVALTYAQVAALRTGGVTVTPPTGSVDSLVDTAANVELLTTTQIAGLGALHVASLATTDSAATFSLAQTLAFETAKVSFAAPPSGSNTALDTAANIEALTTTQIAGLSALKIGEVTASDASLAIKVAQATAFETAGVSLMAPAGDSIEISDTGANLQTLTAAQINGLQALGVGELYASTGSVNFSVADTAALLDDRVVLAAAYPGTITENFADGGYKTYESGLLIGEKTVYADKSYDVLAFPLTSGQTWTSNEYAYGPTGARVSYSVDNSNGSGAVTLLSSDDVLTVASGVLTAPQAGSAGTLDPHAVETITATVTTKDSFVFGPGWGTDTLTGFVATGTTHDTLTFNASAFGAGLTAANQQADLVALLGRTGSNATGAAVVTDLQGDMLTLTGISKTALATAANAVDFVFK